MELLAPGDVVYLTWEERWIMDLSMHIESVSALESVVEILFQYDLVWESFEIRENHFL